ncbi:MAG: nuclease [Acidobacteriia bacterium]|nr:nuclease [Terriglobia bacterium]
MPSDGPVFLREYREWIGATGPLPDSWRGVTEPYSKIFEDPNHGWFKEQFGFLKEIPRNRYEFVLRLYDECLRIKDTDPERARLTNVRWTGTLPYAAMENFDRMRAAMRAWRAAPEGGIERRYLAQDIAFYMGWLGHYTADGAQPLHDTIHHDGWQGPNPKNYTRDPRIHGRFETAFVDLIELREADLAPLVSQPQVLSDPFAAVIAHLDDAYTHVEEVYQMDQRGAFSHQDDRQARALVTRQLARAASLLRDLTYTAWIESGRPPGARSAGQNPISPAHPAYNGETGTAPPPGPAVINRK